MKKECNLEATVSQCRNALIACYKDSNGKQFTTYQAGWYLLDILKKSPNDDDPEESDNGREDDNGGNGKTSKALRIFENALDWQAAIILDRYIEARKLVPQGRKLRQDARLNTRGFVGL
jgi:hypothetical protein